MQRHHFLSLLTAMAVVTGAGLFSPEIRAGEKSGKATVNNVNPAAAEKILSAKKEVVVLDVRTPKEFSAGRIRGAKLLDFYARDFEKDLGALDKDKEYLVYCAVGGRSARAVEKMKGLGFQSIHHLDGGFTAWKKAGKRVER